MDVHIIPTWTTCARWQVRLDALGCKTHATGPEQLESIEELPGSIVVGMCNRQFILHGPRFRELGCKLVWANCMTFMFEHERQFFARCGPADAYVFQSEFQRGELEPQLEKYGYRPETGHLIRGAFDAGVWPYKPRPHWPDQAFVMGRAARPDLDKWSSNTWKIYSAVPYGNKRALILGMKRRSHEKLGTPPVWADCLSPMAIDAHHFYASLHCMMPINGGARENWPRAGLEAMAAGVPIVAQDAWGWREMIQHGETGFLAEDDHQLAHYAAMLAHDESLRMQIAVAARKRLANELANPSHIWDAWKALFASLDQPPNPEPETHTPFVITS